MHPEIKPTRGMTNKDALHIARPGLELEKKPVPENIKEAKVANFSHNSSPSELKEMEIKQLR